jgi:hypothetical protein
MEYFGLIDKIRDYCTEHNWIFIYGNDAFANFAIDQNKFYREQKVLVADFTCLPELAGSKIQAMTYNGIMMLGQKREALTTSNLNEYPIEKYDARLKELSQLLTLAIGQISCENEMEVSNLNLKYDLNKFDMNVDFVACSLNFIQ